MRLLYVFFFSFFVIILSCQSKEVAKPPQFSTGFSLTSSTLTLETVIANWDQSLSDVKSREPAAKINWQEELHQLCMKQDGLCEFSVKSNLKRAVLDKKTIAEIKKNIENDKFEDLKEHTIDFSLKFFAKFKKAKLMEFADHLLTDKSCQTPDMKHALASALEDDLPDYAVKTTIQDLYERNSECPASRTMALSSYRAAMFRLLDQDCLKATPLLEKVTNSSEDYLKPRSLYWSWKCQGQSETAKLNATAKLPYFSYHRILIDDAQPDKSPVEPKENLTPVISETAKNPNLNEAARLVERLIANQMNPAAKAVLEKIRVDKIQETEPEFQVYWTHLLNVTHSGIKKFQILAALINAHPQFRSKTIQSMLFPTSYFEHVQAISKKIDPWLIQSLIRQESAFDPKAKSRVGATGLMQLMPATARRTTKSRGQLKDPVYNVNAGTKFLETLVNKFDGEVHMALAAYNAGPLRVVEWKKRYQTDDPILFVDTIPYRETREYVAFILRNYHWYRSMNIATADNTVQTDTPRDPFNSLYRMATQIEDL